MSPAMPDVARHMLAAADSLDGAFVACGDSDHRHNIRSTAWCVRQDGERFAKPGGWDYLDHLPVPPREGPPAPFDAEALGGALLLDAVPGARTALLTFCGKDHAITANELRALAEAFEDAADVLDGGAS